MKTKLINILSRTFVVAFVVVIAVIISFLTLKGDRDLRYFDTSLDTRIGGPFESSNSRGRYALVKSIVDEGSFFYNDDLANFSTPDVAFYNNKYFSIFTPGISFGAIPFYILGRALGYEQVVTYLFNVMWTILSVVLILEIVRRMSNNYIVGGIGGLAFLFGTNALTYSHSLTQHGLTAFVTLGMILNSVYFKGYKSFLLAGLLYGVGIMADIPNAFILLPALIITLSKGFTIIRERVKTRFEINIKPIVALIGVLPFLIIFTYYNQMTAGSPFTLAQMIGRTENFLQIEIPENNLILNQGDDSNDSAIEFPFYSRNLLNGLYILLISNERGLLYYSPILLVGILGMILAYRTEGLRKLTIVSAATVSIVVLAYGMFGDPWGGWSFGARYMIPANAVLSIFVGYAFYRLIRKPVFALAFFILLSYSLFINTVGSVTTNAIPPKGEALNLPDAVPYTYKYNFDLIESNKSSSYFYNFKLADKVKLMDYSIYLTSIEYSAFILFYLSFMKFSIRKTPRVSLLKFRALKRRILWRKK